ncbi:hypothetical protein [Microlunatus soli]|uniref:Uncharacterized protein n=1 Tax=Microlunatus soli TaxID=630515 RepID=A0A1H1NIE6_9ACTN|nr:hypothetical protein [Microlunatus soli]SDR98630.1 hypothetical protein SAMN04489812_0522 [Microlunatus soli]
MPGNLTTTFENLTSTSSPAGTAAPAAAEAPTAKPATAGHPSDGPLMVVPAGIFGDIIGGLAGTIGEVTGGWFGNAQLGKTLGNAASPIIEHYVPFQVIPPAVAPASAGPDAQRSGSSEPLVVVPAGFLTGVLGGLAGNLAGGALGDLFGDKDLGSQIGSGVLGAVGSVFGPFSVIPPQVAPASAGPGSDGDTAPSEAMVVVPAGFFGDLIGGVAGTVGQIVGGGTSEQVGGMVGQLAKLLPFSAVPPNLSPASAGPEGTGKTQDLVVVPAGFFGSLVSGFGGTIGSAVGGLFGDSKTGGDIGGLIGSVGSLLPFHEVPPALLPASTRPNTETAAEDRMIVVPAGLFGGLLNTLGGTIGSTVGGMFGDAKTGGEIGGLVGSLGKLLPFQVLPSTATAG